jgi:hypothetical protein
VTEADRLGQALVDYAPAAPAVVALDELTHMFAAQLGVKTP